MNKNDGYELKTQTLSPEEIEKLLLHEFGGKIQPIDNEKLARQHRKNAGIAAFKSKFRKP
ncbi:MAG: hypothetical protein P4N41_10000 [Negativicutes bacterium]|nr:hypothetical protein [Negativicutes bacterium]